MPLHRAGRKDAQYPNVATVVGSVDVHYPCDSDVPVHATVCLNPHSLAVESEVLPVKDTVIDALLRQFGVGRNEYWSVHINLYGGGVHEENTGAY
jgi:hypothetical protein